MSKIKSLLNLTPAERNHLVKALVLVVGIRIGLSLMPFPRFQTLLATFRASIGMSRVSVSTPPTPSTQQLAWAVRTVSTYVPKVTCLTQALAAQVLLEQHGYPTIVRIGVTNASEKGNSFQAHAWLESNGKMVIGQSDVAYVPLTVLD